MNGRNIRNAVMAMQNIKNILYSDVIEDNLDDYACLHGPGAMPEFKGDDPFFNIYDYKSNLAKAYIINNLDTVRVEMKECEPIIAPISELINKMLASEELGADIEGVEDLIDEITYRIDEADITFYIF